MKTATVPVLVGLMLGLWAGMSAADLHKGSSVLAIQGNEGNGDFVHEDGGFLIADRHSEMGVQAQYWYLWNDDYAVTAAGGFGFSRESENPGDAADPSDESFRDFYSTWQFRVGADRVGKVNDRIHLYAGPGFQVFGGRRTLKRGGTIAFESPTAVRVGLDGRLGMMIHWGQSFGMAGQVGHYWAYARAKQAGAETKWLPSGSNGAMGFFFSF